MQASKTEKSKFSELTDKLKDAFKNLKYIFFVWPTPICVISSSLKLDYDFEFVLNQIEDALTACSNSSPNKLYSGLFDPSKFIAVGLKAGLFA